MTATYEAKRTFKLAVPIILGELVQMALHLIDSAMIGAINYKQLAAASLVFSVINIPFVLGIGMTVAMSQMVSLANGQNDAQLVSHYFFNGLFICLTTALSIALLIFFGTDILYHLKQDEEVVQFAIPFMKIMAWSMIPMLLFMALKQFADGLEFTKTAMIISILGMPLNVFLNWLLIYGNWGFPRLEIVGAGLGTLITRVLMTIALAWVILRARVFQKYMKVWTSQWKLSLKSIKSMLHIGIPSALQIGMEAGAFAISGILVGMISPVAQAAHQIALSIASFTFMVSMGLAQAGSIRTSNAFGSKDWKKIATIAKTTLQMAMVYGIFCALVFTVFKKELPLIFTQNIDVIHTASILLIVAAIFQIPDALQAIGAGLLRGIKDVKVPTYFIAIAYWIIGIPLGYFLAFNRQMGAKGIWIGLITGLVLVSLSLLFRLRNRIKAAV